MVNYELPLGIAMIPGVCAVFEIGLTTSGLWGTSTGISAKMSHPNSDQ